MKLYVCVEPECSGHQDPLEALLSGQHHLDRKLDTIMSKQDNIDADVVAINAALADIATQTAAVVTGQAALDTAIADIKGSLPADVDTTALDAAAAQLATATGALDSTVSALTTDPNAAQPAAGDAGTDDASA